MSANDRRSVCRRTIQWAEVVYRHRKIADDGQQTEYVTAKDTTIDYYRGKKPIGIVKLPFVKYTYATQVAFRVPTTTIDKDNFFFTLSFSWLKPISLNSPRKDRSYTPSWHLSVKCKL